MRRLAQRRGLTVQVEDEAVKKLFRVDQTLLEPIKPLVDKKERINGSF